MTDFDGETYERDRDRDRLTSQLGRVRGLMSDGRWHSLSGIAAALDVPEASISARLRDLRKPKFGAFIVEREYVSQGLWKYRMRERDPKPEPVARVSLDLTDYQQSSWLDET